MRILIRMVLKSLAASLPWLGVCVWQGCDGSPGNPPLPSASSTDSANPVKGSNSIVMGPARSAPDERSTSPRSFASTSGGYGEFDADLPTGLSLTDEESAKIWDREHYGNLLNAHGFKPLGMAIRTKDAAKLLPLLSDEFNSAVVDQAEKLDYKSDTVVASRRSATSDLRSLSSVQEFADWLFSTCGFITEVEGTQVGVLRIKPLADDDGQWSVDGVLRVWGRHGGEPGEVRVWVNLITSKPTKENLEAGKWLHRLEAKQVAESRAPKSWFHDSTKESGIAAKRLWDNWDHSDDVNSVTGGVYATDFNHDGHVDVLLTDIGQDLERLYAGTGTGSFTDVSDLLGGIARGSFVRSSICAAFVDIDGDGWDDLIYGDGVVRQNLEGQRFKDVTNISNFAILARITHQLMGPSISAIIPADFDRDGKLDIYITRIGAHPKSWLVSSSPKSAPCQLLRNVGDWRFEDVTEKFKIDGGGMSIFSAAWSDLNNDGWPDLYTINEFGDGILYTNHEGKRFEARDIDSQTMGFGAMGLAAGDLNNDGNSDVYTGEMYSKAGSRVIGNMPEGVYDEKVMRRIRSLVDGSELYMNRGGLQFEAKGRQMQVHDVGWSWGPCLADFDNDGLLDIYATCGYISRDRNKPDG